MSDKFYRDFKCEVRAASDEEHGDYITGQPIVFGDFYDVGGYYRETIDEGALDSTDLKDVRFLVNHNFSMIPLARSRNNNANSTMQMEVIPGKGMSIRVDLDTENNAEAKSLYSAVERGDITGMSFMFGVDVDKWEELESAHPKRHVRSISRVMEVSACTFPAYEATSIQTRGLSDALDSARKSLDSAKAEQLKIERQKQKIRILMGV